MAIPEAQVKNFNTLQKAFINGDVCLLECSRQDNGEPVYVICAMNFNKDGTTDMLPFATMFNEDPYTILNPPLDNTEVKES
jgi:hypothetical protein